MLVDLTFDKAKLKEAKEWFKNYKLENPEAKMYFIDNYKLRIERGVYYPPMLFNFNLALEKCKGSFDSYPFKKSDKDKEDWKTILQRWDNEPDNYGVADNIGQIKYYYKNQIKDYSRKYVISISPVFRDLSNKGKGGGWRWHKWGKYIGTQEPTTQYLDDEENIESILCFSIFEKID